MLVPLVHLDQGVERVLVHVVVEVVLFFEVDVKGFAFGVLDVESLSHFGQQPEQNIVRVQLGPVNARDRQETHCDQVPNLQKVFKFRLLRLVLENVPNYQVIFYADVAPEKVEEQAVLYGHEDVTQADVLNFFVNLAQQKLFHLVVDQHSEKSDQIKERGGERKVKP